MTLRLGFFILLLAIGQLSTAAFTTLPPEKSCHEHPKLVGSCFDVHGRLSVYNGAPALRIWKIGTKRMLGVSDQRFADPDIRNVPEEVSQKLNQDVELVGDFTVCPFTRSKPGAMQLVCIDSAKNLSVKKREP